MARTSTLRLAALAALALLAGCKSSDAILLSVRADAPAQQVDLYVQDEATGEVIFHSGFSPVQTSTEKPRDLTKSPLKLALKLSQHGRFKLLLVGVVGDLANGKPGPGATQLFWAGHVRVDGATELSARLLTVPRDPTQGIDDDRDADLWPDATDFVAHVAEAAQLYAGQADLLDCDDKTDMPPSLTGEATPFKAADVNPFAVDACGDDYDQDCDGKERACVDQDHDGDPKGSDCDDADPKRHHATAANPFPDPPNCCGYSLGKTGDEAKMNFKGTPLCPETRCGDGIDQSCRGSDTPCVVDEDCDGEPVFPDGKGDCNDADPTVHHGAVEICGNDVDENCSAVAPDNGLDDGCVPCDLDGDEYQRDDRPNGCPDRNNKHPGMIDCNDDDSGVYPGSIGGKDSGEGDPTGGKLRGALRGTCRNRNPDGTLQDADCNGVVAEGCPATDPDPTRRCDKDGDGFPEYPGNCDTSQPKLDCDDNDPKFYPGAPDKCGDGLAQNCTGDTPCDADADHDGYNVGVDCDDGDPAVHPWAAEACNGKDDDCDGLVDEGNPDQSGAPMVQGGAITACTDDDDGECGKQKGKCVCSKAQESSAHVDPIKRTFCPTESAGGTKPPHCFGAGQPARQSCDALAPKDDDCDGRVDDPTGDNLAIQGQPCGVNVGQCRAGTIVGCDRTQNNCFAQLGRLGPDKAWYVCSSDAVCPVTELCDGLDDDCDGTLAGAPAAPFPVNDERDHDGDKYLACSGCDPARLAPGLLGCGDCNDNAQSVHPGATEQCNGVDDDCDPGTPDGKDQCTGGTSCCPSGCRNLATDLTNCQSCGNSCNATQTNRANACGGAGCQCGTGPACAPGQYCTGSSCATCNTNTHCGPTCAACVGGDQCRADGSGCAGCITDTDCTNAGRPPYCNNGTCLATKPNGYGCGGDAECTTLHCAGGTCCATACALTSCQDAATQSNFSCSTGACLAAGTTACGTFRCVGSACKVSCTTDNDCAAGRYCNGGSGCLTTKPNGGSCGGDTDCTNGHCVGNVCCNSTCASPTCSGAQRIVSSCATGTCTQISSTDCTPFTCSGGACVTSCMTDVSCAAGYYCKYPYDSTNHNCYPCNWGGKCGAACTNCNSGADKDYCRSDGTCQTRIKTGNACLTSNCFASYPSCDQCASGDRLCPISLVCP